MAEEVTKQISVIIAGRSYPLQIKATDEPVIRKMVKEVNEQVNRFQLNHTHKDKQDCLAFTVLTYAVDLHKSRQSFDATQNPSFSDKLSELNALLDKLLQE
ncbi:MAG: cell division protein ZapA [Saprospiraceae bacterium]|nr:cell division protein ZapA [Saprospiraceae bacterium]